jgi:D-serine deaminase-like pyridoxal phosphate-dependent protein
VVVITLAEFVAAEERQPLAWSDKMAGPAMYGRTSASLGASPVAMSGLPTPMLTIEKPSLERNIATMQEWCDAHGVLLAPHGKTTMAPRLWRDQIDAGSWGITVANEAQLHVAVGSGVRRVHLANTLLSPQGLRWLAEARVSDPELVVHFWVDSIASVRLIEEALSGTPFNSKIPVLVEVGPPKGRAGARTIEQALGVASAISASRHLQLVGVAGYEGVINGASGDGTAAVDQYLASIVAVHNKIATLYPEGEVFLSAGGSAYFDRVVAILGPAARGSVIPTRVLVRAGAYVAHDDGIYARMTPSRRGAGPVFTAALHAWTRVVSTPELGVAILDAGRRDLPCDQGMPLPQQLRRPNLDGSFGKAIPLEATLTELNDQHAFLKYSAGTDIRPGDVVRLGVSHPCTAFDKWRTIPLIENAGANDPTVHGFVSTYF